MCTNDEVAVASRLVIAWRRSGADSSHPDADDLLRVVVARFCGADLACVRVGRVCPGCGSGAHGRPHVTVEGHTAPHVSLSRTDGLVCVAVTDAGPVGVDVERSGAAAFEDFAAVGLHPLERSRGALDQTRTWVRKESLVKATGDGLSVDLRQVRLTEPADHPRLLAWEAPRPPGTGVWMHDVAGPDGYVLAATVLAELDPSVSVWDAVAESQAARVRPKAAPAVPAPTATR